MAQIPDAQIEIIEKPIKWEYKVIANFSNYSLEDINLFGLDKWELVSVVFDIGQHTLMAYLKRPISESE